MLHRCRWDGKLSRTSVKWCLPFLQGCDMRNIFRVVLWKLPPSFCALAQRSGRAVRDFSQLGEAILFVPAKVLKDGLAAEEARLAREVAAEPHNQEGDFAPEREEGVDVVAGQVVAIGEGGARVEQNADIDEVDPDAVAAADKKKKRKAARQSAADALEAMFLTSFACTKQCRRIVWDEYFRNSTKRKPPKKYSVPADLLCSTANFDSPGGCPLLRRLRSRKLPRPFV